MSLKTYQGNPVSYVIPLATDGQGNPSSPSNGGGGGGGGTQDVNIVSDSMSPTGFATTSAQTTTSAAALPDTPCKGALIQAASDNSEMVKIGGSASQDWELAPGAQLPLTVINLNQVYIVSASGEQTVNVVYST